MNTTKIPFYVNVIIKHKRINHTTLTNPTTLPHWLQPHSLAWHKQLSELQHTYHYDWNSTLTAPNGETIFDEEVLQMITDKKVLDVGCGMVRLRKNVVSLQKKS